MAKLALKIVTCLRRLYWWITRPNRSGVKIIVDYNEQILLVKNKYDKFWYLPGGQVKHNEGLSNATKRELREECGFEVLDLTLLGVFYNSQEYKRDRIALFATQLDKLPRLKAGIEIEFCSFFGLNNLPENTSPATKQRVLEYRNEAINGGQW